jgi:RNA polymerase sigma-70 factor (sigma-E family)
MPDDPPQRVSREDMFDEFVQARWSATMRFAYALTLDHGHAEDLTQESMAKLWFRWKNVTDNPDAYLRRILVSTFLAKRRRRWWGEHPTAELPDQPVESETARVDEQLSLLEALRTLSSRQRVVVLLRYAEDLPEREVAELVGCSIGAVKSHATRGLASLRRVQGLTLQTVPTDQDLKESDQ